MIVKFSPTELVANLKAALLAACVDPARVHMHVVRLEIRHNVARFVASNGHWVWVNEIRVDAPEGDHVVQIPIKDVKQIVKGLQASKKAATWTVELDVAAGTFTQLGAVIPFKSAQTTFPPYHLIIPAMMGKKRVVVSIATEYVANICAAFSLLHPDPAVSIESGDSELEPCAFVSKACPDALAIIMPRRDTAADSAGLRARYGAHGKKSTAA